MSFGDLELHGHSDIFFSLGVNRSDVGTSSTSNDKFYKALRRLHGPWCKQPLSLALFQKCQLVESKLPMFLLCFRFTPQSLYINIILHTYMFPTCYAQQLFHIKIRNLGSHVFRICSFRTLYINCSNVIIIAHCSLLTTHMLTFLITL